MINVVSNGFGTCLFWLSDFQNILVLPHKSLWAQAVTVLKLGIISVLTIKKKHRGQCNACNRTKSQNSLAEFWQKASA